MLAALLLAAGASAAATVPTFPRGLSVLPRAASDSPTGGYAPGNTTCPSTPPSIRKADGLSSEETAWLAKRSPKAQSAFAEFLSRANISDFDYTSYLAQDEAQPVLAAAISGGGYRALMYGAGFLKATDNRTTDATSDGGVGGLLQSLTYLGGLSGGSWLVGSMYMNNFTSIESIQSNTDIWQFQNSILSGPPSVSSTLGYLATLQSEVKAKQAAGFDVSLTDYWGRALAYQLIDASGGGPGYTYSSISYEENFAAGEQPLPVIVAVGRAEGTTVINLNSTVFEFTPLEFGSWDASPAAFAPMKYLGSNFNGGTLVDNSTCLAGFDSGSFVMGTSSSLFNVLLANNAVSSLNLTTTQTAILNTLLASLNATENDIAAYRPNPFYGFSAENNKLSNETALDLVDGGEDGQNIPLWPLLQESRNVDVIYAVDASSDTSAWPNGAALRATYERSQDDIGQGTPFPAIPSANTFVNKGLNKKPTFFGCNSTTTGPLIVYLPNAPYTVYSNVSTYTMAYSISDRDALILNGYNSASQGNSSATLNATNWPTCVACAALHNSFLRTNTSAPADCSACFTEYCWDGTTDETDVVYDPTLLLSDAVSGNGTLEGSSTTDDSSSGAISFKFSPAVLIAAVTAGSWLPFKPGSLGIHDY